MGGGVRVVKENQHRQLLDSELRTVYYFVHFANPGNISLFDIEKLQYEISKFVSDYFTKNGIIFKDLGRVGEGGGGSLSSDELIKYLLQLKDIVGLLLFILSIFKRTFHFNPYKRFTNVQPCVTIDFFIESNADLSYLSRSEIKNVTTDKLLNLYLVCSKMIDSLCKEKEYLKCDCSTEARINSLRYSAEFVVSHDRRSKFNLSRLMNIIQNLQIRTDYHVQYSITKWKLILRTESDRKGLIKKYYLFLSSSILSDYLQN